jgi:CRISPR-associated protein Cmr6
MNIDLRRTALQRIFMDPASEPHAGLLMRRGMRYWPRTAEGAADGGTEKAAVIDSLAQVRPSALYCHAYDRWRRVTADAERFANFVAELEARLYIGVSRDSALESAATVQHAYGMPMIPGSAVKGLARACFRDWFGGEAQAMRYVFGNEHDSTALEPGALHFHDAWWVPQEECRPFVREVVTPHHRDYYGSAGGEPATDFDSPIPAPQVAVQGEFYFVIEGEPAWASLVASVLKQGLAQRGIGGKRSSGYGAFKPA